MPTDSLDQILKSFEPNDPSAEELKKGKPVGVWLPLEYKERYDRIQRSSGRAFSKKLRELIKAAIDIADKRAS